MEVKVTDIIAKKEISKRKVPAFFVYKKKLD